MTDRFNIKDYLIVILLLAAAILGVWSFMEGNGSADTGKAAAKVGNAVGKRMAILESHISEALSSENGLPMDEISLPQDMVIYRYDHDTLQAWKNRFPVFNDDITSRLVFQTISRPGRDPLYSPLSEVTEEVSFKNYGTKWYLMKMEALGHRKVIAGLEIMNTMGDQNTGGINRRIRPNGRLSIVPLSDSGGSAVKLNGSPVFKIVNYSSGKSVGAHSSGVWISFVLLVIALLIFLMRKKTLRRLLVVLGLLVLIMTGAYFWGRYIKDTSPLFSPAIYANGQFFDSLGAVLIVSLGICLGIYCIFSSRKIIYKKILESRHPRKGLWIFLGCDLLLMAGILSFFTVVFRSVILNSNISLELYKLGELDVFSVITYISVVALLMTIPLLFQMLVPVLKELFGIKFDAFSVKSRILLAAILAAYMVVTAGVLGFRKEQNRINVWANRLAMDRDISLELQFRMIEDNLASDRTLGDLTRFIGGNSLILNRIRENYLFRIIQDYDLVVELFNENDRNERALAYFNSVISEGTPIADNSRFMYMRDAGGHNIYVGNFVYYNERSGITRMLLTVSPKSNREDRGFASILGFSAPGQVLMPSVYSYAKYISDKLTTYKGTYAYPTILDQAMRTELLSTPDGVLRKKGNDIHFVNFIADDEFIIISREKTENINYIVAFLILTLILYLCFSTLTFMRKIGRPKEKNYYKARINTAMMVALIMTLISLAAVSVLFVYRRNNANLRNSMVDKVNSLQTMLQARSRFMVDYRGFNSQEAVNVLEDISSSMKSDITLYTPGGKEFRTTTPEVFDRMLLVTRMNEDAFENIVFQKKRYFINKETVGGKKTYFLYAPLFNTQGKMLAIMSAPFTDDSFDFKTEAILHFATIIAVFLILLLMARFITMTVVEKMFKPLSEIGRRMNAADINNLEYIVYEREDEVSTLVKAYNRMVHDLYDSTKQLTQAERDKAWATMARQVAHEIKNPLTPIKLQIQRLIRMKKAGNPLWSERFDEISTEVLKQIDLLADTANEFSTFAKLYTEESVQINLDKLLQEEIDLFDSRDNITISYMGLEDAHIKGPKPQLTRVIVNLVSNSIQAIENAQAEAKDKGEEPQQGQIAVSLRHSTKDGFYDIVFEDNGPGVSEENRSKLFTPNFTTKSNGTGLGLSICRSILEKCNGEITYSRSFALKGACFTVRFPKNDGK